MCRRFNSPFDHLSVYDGVSDGCYESNAELHAARLGMSAGHSVKQDWAGAGLLEGLKD